jgi:hypothetical protein
MHSAPPDVPGSEPPTELDPLIRLYEEFSPQRATHVLLSEFDGSLAEKGRRLVLFNMLVMWSLAPSEKNEAIQRSARNTSRRVLRSHFKAFLRGLESVGTAAVTEDALQTGLAPVLPVLLDLAFIRPTGGRTDGKVLRAKANEIWAKEAIFAALVIDTLLRVHRFKPELRGGTSIRRAAKFIQAEGYSHHHLHERNVRKVLPNFRASACLLWALREQWPKRTPADIYRSWMKGDDAITYDHHGVVEVLRNADSAAVHVTNIKPETKCSESLLGASRVPVNELALKPFSADEERRLKKFYKN